MRHLKAAVWVAGLALSLQAQAAEVTRVASSFEEDDPLGLQLTAGFERTRVLSKILREASQPVDPEAPDGERTVRDVSELLYTGTDARLNLGLQVGLYRDLELRFGLPLVFAQDEHWRYAAGTTEANSTLFNNCVGADGQLLTPDCATTLQGTQPLYTVPFQTYRGGLGNLRFGLAYAVFNQVRDETKPTWVLAFGYEAPTASRLDPSVVTLPGDRGGFGDRHHRYTVSTALSRRIGIVDPYFRASYTLPFRGPGWYSNCENPSPANMAAPDNCNTDAWSRSRTGIQAPHTAELLFGSELYVYEEPEEQQSFVIDFRGRLGYVGPGRYYNVLSGLAGKLLQTQDYLQMGGTLGFVARPADFFRLRASGALAYNTEHLLTSEEVGRDVDSSGRVDLYDPQTGALGPEVNPNFDFRVDLPSRRFRATEMGVFELRLEAEFIF